MRTSKNQNSLHACTKNLNTLISPNYSSLRPQQKKYRITGEIPTKKLINSLAKVPLIIVFKVNLLRDLFAVSLFVIFVI